MSQRFFVSEPISGDRISLGGDEGRHLARVMRARPGDVVTLFDGRGAELEAQVTQVGRSAVDLQVLMRRDVDRESPVAITLGVALPKGDRQRFLIEKSVELGVAVIVPLETERGVAQPTASALDRLRRAVIEASKQCGRNRLMQIAEPLAVAKFAHAPPPGAVRLIAHPMGTPLSAVVGAQLPKAPGVFLAVGPEGGFTDAEVSLAAEAGWQSVSLGPRILRVETAAMALAAQWGLEGS